MAIYWGRMMCLNLVVELQQPQFFLCDDAATASVKTLIELFGIDLSSPLQIGALQQHLEHSRPICGVMAQTCIGLRG
eukprot:3672392-Prorocentrum_lima.AAC.1